jgi:hypothetical protein
MRGIIQSQVTPQQKMVAVNNKFGNSNIKNQQGSTRVIFDSLPITAGPTNFRFFENANTRTFPLTNIGSEGNRLGVGETFTVEKIYFNAVTYDAVNNTITASLNGLNFAAGDVAIPFATGEFDFFIANSQVVKQLPTTFTQGSNFNPTALNTNDHAFGMATDIVIPPLLEYVASLKTTPYATGADLAGYTHIQLFMYGTAGIIAPQTTF